MISSSNINYFLAEALKEFGKMINTVEDERDRMVSHYKSFFNKFLPWTCSGLMATGMYRAWHHKHGFWPDHCRKVFFTLVEEGEGKLQDLEGGQSYLHGPTIHMTGYLSQDDDWNYTKGAMFDRLNRYIYNKICWEYKWLLGNYYLATCQNIHCE